MKNQKHRFAVARQCYFLHIGARLAWLPLIFVFGAAALGLFPAAAGAAGTKYRLAAFRADVTPPVGSPLCAGLVKPVASVADPLQAVGVVLLGAGKPIVLCAVDWCEIRNDDHIFWREQIARAAGTRPDRVAVQCVHPHDAPIADSAAAALLNDSPSPVALMDVAWCRQAAQRAADAVHVAVRRAEPVTHVGIGQAAVLQVASSRRILGPDGKVQGVRYSSTTDPKMIEAPEGLIDPMLKSVSFWNGGHKLAVLHYYATHPMSHYGEGEVSCDFAGLARERRSAEDQGAVHVYFNGGGGNITAGKYNNGRPEIRAVLSGRIYDAMRASEQAAERLPTKRIEWRVEPVRFQPRLELREAELLKLINTPSAQMANRVTAALELSYLRHVLAGGTIPLSCLAVGDRLRILHLPGEPFVEYQLYAQREAAGRFVAVAGYSDGGPGYLPLARSYEEGGYEPTQAFVGPETEALLKASVARLVK